MDWPKPPADQPVNLLGIVLLTSTVILGSLLLVLHFIAVSPPFYFIAILFAIMNGAIFFALKSVLRRVGDSFLPPNDLDINSLTPSSHESYNTFSVDRHYRYLHFSEMHKNEAERLFNYTPVLGESILRLLPPELSQFMREYFDATLQGKYLNLRRMVEGGYYQMMMNPMYGGQKEIIGITCISEDITEKIRVEQQLEEYHENLEKVIEKRTKELQEQRDFFQKVIDSVSNLIFVRDEKGKYVLVNKSAAGSFPKSIETALGKTILETHKDPKQAQAFLLEDKEIIQTGKQFISESIFEDKSGLQKSLYLTKSLLEVEEKKYVLGVHTDITDLKKQENALKKSNKKLSAALDKLEKAQDKLVESEKLASLGQLTAGLAHEINNPINYVSGNVAPLLHDFEDLNKILEKVTELKSDLQQSEKAKELLTLMDEVEVDELISEIRKLIEGIADGTSRVKELMHSLKNLSRQNENTLIKIDVNKIIKSTMALIRPSIPVNIEIEMNLDKLPPILGSPGEISQVLLNIIDNALFAMGETGTLAIFSKKVEETIIIVIEDSGRGIPEKNMKKIFEPFYTTKEVGEGTGLGLAISHQIVNKHQGQIDVKSREGQGTRFTITLPIVQQSPA